MNNKMKVLVVLTGLMMLGQANAAEVKSALQQDGSTKITVETIKTISTDPVKVEYTISQDSPFNQSATRYKVKMYRIEDGKNQLSKAGVYENKSSLLKIDGEPKSVAQAVSTHKDPLASLSVNNETSYLKSVKSTSNFDKEIQSFDIEPGIVKSGFNFKALPVGENVYNINLSQNELLGIKQFKAGEDAIGLPEVASWSATNVLYLPEGKTARLESPSYDLGGKSYKNVYLISANK